MEVDLRHTTFVLASDPPPSGHRLTEPTTEALCQRPPPLPPGIRTIRNEAVAWACRLPKGEEKNLWGQQPLKLPLRLRRRQCLDWRRWIPPSLLLLLHPLAQASGHRRRNAAADPREAGAWDPSPGARPLPPKQNATGAKRAVNTTLKNRSGMSKTRPRTKSFVEDRTVYNSCSVGLICHCPAFEVDK